MFPSFFEPSGETVTIYFARNDGNGKWWVKSAPAELGKAVWMNGREVEREVPALRHTNDVIVGLPLHPSNSCQLTPRAALTANLLQQFAGFQHTVESVLRTAAIIDELLTAREQDTIEVQVIDTW